MTLGPKNGHNLTVREIQTTYTDLGEGPAVLLLHGYPFDKSMWRDQIEAFSRNGFRALAPDLRGLGAVSDKLQFVEPDKRRQAEAYRTITTMEVMARDAANLLDRLEISEAVVCGLSMGGYVAFEFRKLFASRVRALILAGTRAPADNEPERQVRFQSGAAHACGRNETDCRRDAAKASGGPHAERETRRG